MSQWQPVYNTATGVAVTYGAIGSGGGIAQITARTVDFGASDAPLTPSQFSTPRASCRSPGRWRRRSSPTTSRACPTSSSSPAPLLADIWMGKVTTWNDPGIAKLNPGVSLPSTKDHSGVSHRRQRRHLRLHRLPVTRSARSGSRRSAPPRRSASPPALGGRATPAWAACSPAPTAPIGYVAISYVLQNKFDYALVQNSAGQVPRAGHPEHLGRGGVGYHGAGRQQGLDRRSAGVRAGRLPDLDLYLCPRPTHSPKAATLKPFLTWAITPGSSTAPRSISRHCRPKIVTADRATIAKIK